MEGIAGRCSGNRTTLGKISIGVRHKRFMFVINSDKSNGSALVGLVVGRLGPARNAVVIGNRGLGHVGREGVTGCEEKLKIMFRSFHLLGSHDVCRGVTFTLHIARAPAHMVGGGMPTTLSLIKLTRGCGSFPGRLSNKRRRHMTVTETVMGRPTVLLTSRPAKGLSPAGS